MKKNQQFSKNTPISKLTMYLLLGITLSACSATPRQAENTQITNRQITTEQDITNHVDIEHIDIVQCNNHAQNIADHAESVASTAQYLAAAKAMNNCVTSALQNRSYKHNPEHKPVIMKMMAITALNFIKSGDVDTASREVERFKRVYPRQDLYFADYTSFLDTATALLSLEPLSASQVTSLNISRVLRNEIERKHYWLNH